MTKITKKISRRDVARTGKRYFKALRGYQQRKDIINSMINSLNTKSLSKEKVYLVDLGCGPGIVGLSFYNHFKEKLNLKVHFLDINPGMLSAIPKNKDFKTIEGDVTNLKLKHNFYDVVVMKQVLDYLPRDHQIKTLKNIRKILKPSGQFILSVLIPPFDNDYYFRLNNWLYTEREKVLNPSAPIKKYIVSKKRLMKWLTDIGFRGIKIHYVYDIPLSVKDFVKSFGLTKKQEKSLIDLYKKVINKDKEDRYKSRKLRNNDYELTEKAMIISCYK